MSTYDEVKKGEYVISTNPNLLDIEIIHDYLSNHSYWAKNIPKQVVFTSINHSFCFGIYYKDEQIGFARVITDKATFAYLADVFILPSHQGKGLSKWLLQTIHTQKELQGLRRWMLGTRDAHGLYEQFGWSVLDEETCKRFMQVHNKEAYQ